MKIITNSGFTLVELMVSVLIVGLLSNIAYPSYKTYVVKSKMSEVFLTVGRDKTVVSEFFLTNGRIPVDADEANVSDASSNKYLTGVQYENAPDPRITYEVGNLGDSRATGIFVFESTTANGNIQWRCRFSTEANALPREYLPNVCE